MDRPAHLLHFARCYELSPSSLSQRQDEGCPQNIQTNGMMAGPPSTLINASRIDFRDIKSNAPMPQGSTPWLFGWRSVERRELRQLLCGRVYNGARACYAALAVRHGPPRAHELACPFCERACASRGTFSARLGPLPVAGGEGTPAFLLSLLPTPRVSIHQAALVPPHLALRRASTDHPLGPPDHRLKLFPQSHDAHPIGTRTTAKPSKQREESSRM